MREISLREACNVHAYVLMTNHVHLLMTPAASGRVPRVMQSLGRRYVRYINDRYRRTGTLWEGRYKSSLVDGETYLLHCYRYIELKPVRTRMSADPLDYPWSSHAYNAFGHDDPLIHAHPTYLALGSTDDKRHSGYGPWARRPFPKIISRPSAPSPAPTRLGLRSLPHRYRKAAIATRRTGEDRTPWQSDSRQDPRKCTLTLRFPHVFMPAHVVDPATLGWDAVADR